MRTRFFQAIVLAVLVGVCVPHAASAQESAADFNRREWQRQNGGGNFFAGPKASAPAVRRTQPSHRQEARQAPPAPPPQDFFSALFGAPARSAARDYGSDGGERARITITPSTGLSGGAGGSGERSEKSYSGSGTSAFCVRTCDGRYFPLQGRPSSPGDPNAIAQCAAFCPAATTEVFIAASSESGIDGAENKSGRTYSSLPNAFAFRERVVPGCSCRSDGALVGIGRIDAMHDPTLKKGDVIMTSDGARVFTGNKSRPPFREKDFVEPGRFPSLPRSMRDRIAELTVL